jgi:hypothetical protein
MVKPTVIDIEVLPGRTSRVDITLRNTTQSPQMIDLELAELTQTPEGTWLVPDPEENPGLKPTTASLVPWARVGSRSLRVDARARQEVGLLLDIPAGASGYYFAAVVAQTRRPENVEGIGLVLRFVIPVIVKIKGRPLRQDIEIEDVALEAVAGGVDETTKAYCSVLNRGRTYSRIEGSLAIDLKDADRWRPVTRVEVGPQSIVPGVTLELAQDLARRLPSGTYRIRAEIFVDGRRHRPLEKTIEFEGHPGVVSFAADAFLKIDPERIEVAGAPGNTRTSILRLRNPAADSLEVSLDIGMPKSLMGVMVGQLSGDMLSAAEWIDVRPKQFSMRPGGRQNVRVTSRFPADGLEHATYYATMGIRTVYPDSQTAGDRELLMTLANRDVDPKVEVAIDRFDLAIQEDAKHVMQVKIANLGSVHVEPIVTVDVTDSTGRLQAQHDLDGTTSFLLPMGVAQFTDVINWDLYDPKVYTLSARVHIGGSVVAEEDLKVAVTESDGGSRLVRVLNTKP